MTADIPLMMAPPGEPNEHVCKLHGVATTGAGGGGGAHGGQYGYTHVWQLRGPDLAALASSSTGDYQATTTAADGGGGLDAPTTTRHRGDAGCARTLTRRGDHLYDCPLFDDRLLARLQTTGNHAHSPGCRRHQVQQLSRDARCGSVESVEPEKQS